MWSLTTAFLKRLASTGHLGSLYIELPEGVAKANFLFASGARATFKYFFVRSGVLTKRALPSWLMMSLMRGIGLVLNFKTAFKHLKSLQNLQVQSGLGTKMMGIKFWLVESSTTPWSTIFHTSVSTASRCAFRWPVRLLFHNDTRVSVDVMLDYLSSSWNIEIEVSVLVYQLRAWHWVLLSFLLYSNQSVDSETWTHADIMGPSLDHFFNRFIWYTCSAFRFPDCFSWYVTGPTFSRTVYSPFQKERHLQVAIGTKTRS